MAKPRDRKEKGIKTVTLSMIPEEYEAFMNFYKENVVNGPSRTPGMLKTEAKTSLVLRKLGLIEEPF